MRRTGIIVAGALFTSSLFLLNGCSQSVASVDLDRVLDISQDTLYRFENSPNNTQDEAALAGFANELEQNFNSAQPPAHSGPIGINLQNDGSMEGYLDGNGNHQKDDNEPKLFLVEIDGESERLIATDANETVRESHFSGSGLLAGYLIGSMLGRQRAAGISPSSLSSKKAISKSAYSSARSRTGSGSHSTGK